MLRVKKIILWPICTALPFSFCRNRWRLNEQSCRYPPCSPILSKWSVNKNAPSSKHYFYSPSKHLIVFWVYLHFIEISHRAIVVVRDLGHRSNGKWYQNRIQRFHIQFFTHWNHDNSQTRSNAYHDKDKKESATSR